MSNFGKVLLFAIVSLLSSILLVGILSICFAILGVEPTTRQLWIIFAMSISLFMLIAPTASHIFLYIMEINKDKEGDQ